MKSNYKWCGRAVSTAASFSTVRARRTPKRYASSGWHHVHPIGMAIVTLLVSAWLNASADDSTLSPEDYRVYAAALSYIREMNQISTALVVDETEDAGKRSPVASIQELKKGIEGDRLSLEIEGDLVTNMERVHSLRNHLDREKLTVEGFSLVPQRVLDGIFAKAHDNKSGWKSLRKQYSDTWGIIRISRVAYSKDGGTALMSASGIRAGDFGWGVYLLLKRINAAWKVAAMQPTWIS